ncbi:ABC transporter permease [Ensifer sp. ENS07]|uniref:ABC transporter permease n=1 Tax=Ensifer sp. ENS07 TaxID=2769274 RepID=UPI00177C8681|nr:ABC transporter permease [Ensifer sp. ENS07]
MELLKLHVRVTFSLMIREISTRYGKRPGGYLWAFVDPVAHVMIMTVIFQAVSRVPALGSSFPLFFATGYLPYMSYTSMQSFVAGTIKANKSLLSYPIVSPFDAVVSRYLVQFMTSFLVSLLVFEAVSLENHLSVSVDYSKIVGAASLGSLLGFGVGLANISMFTRWPLYEQAFSLMMRPLFMLSGVFFLPDSMPKPFADYMLYNPIVHVIMWFRTGVYPEYRATGLDIGYAGEFAAVYLIVGLVLFTLSSREIREERF